MADMVAGLPSVREGFLCAYTEGGNCVPETKNLETTLSNPFEGQCDVPIDAAPTITEEDIREYWFDRLWRAIEDALMLNDVDLGTAFCACSRTKMPIRLALDTYLYCTKAFKMNFKYTLEVAEYRHLLGDVVTPAFSLTLRAPSRSAWWTASAHGLLARRGPCCLL